MVTLSSHEAIKNPYPIYNRLREQFPVCKLEPENVWVISRYEDVSQGLRDYNVFSSRKKAQLFSPLWLPEDCRTDFFLPTYEPPQYHAYRSVLDRIFANNVVNLLVPKLNDALEPLASVFMHKKEVEFVSEYVYPFISEVLRIITGLKNFQTIEDTRKWLKAIERSTDPNISNQEKKYIEATIRAQKHVFNKIVDKPGAYNSSFVENLLDIKINNTPITHNQVVSILELVFQSGFQTAVHLISGALFQLIYNSSISEKLKHTPDLVPNFVEELLRLYSSAPIAIRHTAQDVTLHNVTIPVDSTVYFLLAAANRDPRVFSNPDSYDLTRKDNRHVAFGYGPHICLGLHLARLELKVVIPHLLSFINAISCPEYHELDWSNTPLFRALERLPITIK